MTGDNDTYIRNGGIDVELCEIVDDVDEYITHSHQFGHRKARRPGLRVVVASHRNQRSDDGKFFENLRLADVAAMNDVVGARKKRTRLGPQKSMGIGDKSYAQVIDCGHGTY